ncbi:hypothetical protein BK124_02140 [Paenibacillus amylolyticus]|nr:hypothetical protein BK124_02140 [Paenibacillus amylolyticus]
MDSAHAEGSHTSASGAASHAEGYMTLATIDAAHAEGAYTTASGYESHAEGYLTISSGHAAHAEGARTIASGYGAHAEGADSDASGNASHTEGVGAAAVGEASHAEGTNTTASGAGAHAEGQFTVASEDASHAEGFQTTASGLYAHAEGFATRANGLYAHAEGYSTIASGMAAHAEGGLGNTASGTYSHAEGTGTIASDYASHAEGAETTASGNSSHAEGEGTLASGIYSHAQGQETRSTATASSSEGAFTQANANYSHSEGNFTVVLPDHVSSHIMGRNGQTLYPASWHLANGISPGSGLAAVLQGSTGNLYIDGTVMSPAADYAEMFETIDGQPIEPGYFVTTVGEKVRKTTQTDNYILGVTSAVPSVIGRANHLNWKDKYLVDEWGRKKYEDIIIEEEVDGSGKVLVPAHSIHSAVINPEYDPSREYVSRLNRPEWVAVGTMGMLLVRDDGTCIEDEFCLPNDEGVATATTKGYRVLKRTGANQIRIYVK